MIPGTPLRIHQGEVGARRHGNRLVHREDVLRDIRRIDREGDGARVWQVPRRRHRGARSGGLRRGAVSGADQNRIQQQRGDSAHRTLPWLVRADPRPHRTASYPQVAYLAYDLWLQPRLDVVEVFPQLPHLIFQAIEARRRWRGGDWRL